MNWSENIEHLKIIVVCILSFGPSLFLDKNEFVFDDGAAIISNEDVSFIDQPISNNIESITFHDFWGQDINDWRSHKSYRPIVTFMFHLEYRFFGEQNLATYMKRINLLFHIVICCFIHEVFRRILPAGHDAVISMATLIFAAHPIHTEVICSAVGRADLLCAFVFLGSLIHHMDLIEEEKKTCKVGWFRFIVLFDAGFICVFCKEVGIMLLPFCIVYDLLANGIVPNINRRNVKRRFDILMEKNKNVIIRCVFLTLMTMGLILVRGFFTGYTTPQFLPFESPVSSHPSLYTRLTSALYIHALNAWLLICPDWLCCDWSHESLKLIETWTDYRMLYAFLFYALLIHALNKGCRHVCIALSLMIIPFIPSSHIISIGFVVADRVLYIPSIGFCLLIAIGINHILPKFPKITYVAFVLLLVLFMTRSNERSIDWQNNLNLFKSAVRVCPNNAKIYYNLAQISSARGDHIKSLEYSIMSSNLNPNSTSTLNSLGAAYRMAGKVKEAIETHKKVLKLDPENAIGWMSLGIAYVEDGKLDAALEAYLKADKLKPNHGKIIFNLSNLYFRMRNLPMAKKMLEKNLQLEPRSQRAHINLLAYYTDFGTQDELKVAVNKATLRAIDHVPLLEEFVTRLSNKNIHMSILRKFYLRILEIDPNNPKAHGQLSIEYQRHNKQQKAIEHYDKALASHPSYEFGDEQYKNAIKKWKSSTQRPKP